VNEGTDAKVVGYAGIGCGTLILVFAIATVFWPGIVAAVLIIGICAAVIIAHANPDTSKPEAGQTTATSQAAAVEEPVVRCPRCKSTQVQAFRKGFRAGRAAVGWAFFGIFGALAGGSLGAGKVDLVCLKCGKRFKPGI